MKETVCGEKVPIFCVRFVSPFQIMYGSTTGTHSYDIVIMGAGLAGLSAVISLNRAGHEFLVLEARDRVGERRHSAPIGGEEEEDQDNSPSTGARSGYCLCSIPGWRSLPCGTASRSWMRTVVWEYCGTCRAFDARPPTT